MREAVAALRADGLVTTRQGSGAYVAADVSRVPFRIDPEGLSSIEDVLAVMELRLAIEVEAAALAAERITPRRLAADRRAPCAPSRRRLRKGEGAVNEDFAFHLAIAEASGNPRFAELLEFPRAPRHSAPERAPGARARRRSSASIWSRIQREHRRIHEAIAQRRPRRGPQGHAPII